MLVNLPYDEKIVLEKWGVTVRPYLLVEDIEHIINQLLTCNNGMERDMILIADIIAVCTDLYTGDEDVHYTYEEILYSGFWADIMEACPILVDNIRTIHREVAEYNSVQKKLGNLIDTITNKVEQIDVSAEDIAAVQKALLSFIPDGEE